MAGRRLSEVLKSGRSLSSLAESSSRKTHIILVHEGFPKNEFYARIALSKEAQAYYNLPRRWNLEIPKWMVRAKVARCMEEYGRLGDVQDKVMGPLSTSLSAVLSTLLPELGTVSISTASPYEDPTIQDELNDIMSAGTSRLVIMPLQPHFACLRSGLLLNEVSRCLSSLTIPSPETPNTRIVPFSTTEMYISCLERWSTHPVISNVWSSRLDALGSKIDAVLFAAPTLRGYGRTEYTRSVYASAERTIAETRFGLPWKLAFFNSWNQWDLPIMESVSSQLRHFRGMRIGVVPITSVIPTFDTISTLPVLLERSKEEVNLVSPSVDSVLVQGMAEALKNHLLGRRSGQLQLTCTGCVRADCQTTRELLV